MILDVKLNFELNEFHHIFTMMEGGIEIFGKDYEKEVFKKYEDVAEVPKPILEGS